MKKLYDVKLAVVGKSHFYDVTLSDGQAYRFAGVTGHLQILNKPALVGWAKKESLLLVQSALTEQINSDIKITPEWIDDLIKRAKKRPDNIKDAAADLGTRVHEFIDLIIHGKEPKDLKDIPPDLDAPVTAFKTWWKNSGIELVMGDTKVASLIYEFGGSLDALGRRNGSYIILDWKTSNAIYSEYSLQVSAYAQAFAETYGIFVQEAIICRFGKKLPIDFETRKVGDIDRSFRAFLAAKELSELMRFEHFEEAI